MNSKPSKSAKKRAAQAIDALAKRLLELTNEQLDTIPLGDELHELVVATRKMSSRSALRRQRLYLAKKLRQADTGAIQLACDALARDQQGEQRLFHQAERWRDRMLAERGGALAEFTALAGHQNERLVSLVGDLGRSLPEAVERRIAREIFREIHAELAARM